ncbi:MAG: hypothetical protein AB1483_02775 [Candidatus Zixiibacteriota bacterium]
MKKRIILLAVFVLCVFQLAHAEKKIQVSLAPTIGHSFGETEYILKFRSYILDEFGEIAVDDFGNPIIYEVKSLLEFPMDVIFIGGSILMEPVLDKTLWSVETGVYTTVNDPGGAVTDSDWDSATSLWEETKFSYTESDATMSSLRFNIEVTRRLLTLGKLRVSALGGFRYQNIKQDIYGYEGWYRILDTVNFVYSSETYTQSGSGPVGYYEVTYKQPQIGLLTSTEFPSGMTLKLKTAFTPVWFDDYDDHILRNKESTADGDGAGFEGSLRARFKFSSLRAPLVPYLDIFADYMTLHATGYQTQTWYGDDGATPDFDDTGLSVSNIYHEVNSTQYNIGFKLGLLF